MSDHPFDRAVWRFWPWISWLLPVVLIAFALTNSRDGLSTIVMLYLSPVVLVAFGLVSSLPQWVLKARGHESTPPPVSALMVTAWVSAIAIAIVVRSDLQGGAVTASTRGLTALMSTATALLVIALAGAIVGAIALPAKDEWGLWRFSGPAALVVAPLALALVTAVQGTAPIHVSRDSQNIDSEVAMQLQTERWQDFNTFLTPARAAACPTEWRLSGGSGLSVYEGTSFDDSQYTLYSNWRCEAPLTSVEFLKTIVPAIEASGWRLIASGEGENPGPAEYQDASGAQTQGFQAQFEAAEPSEGLGLPASPEGTNGTLTLMLEPGDEKGEFSLLFNAASPSFWLEGGSVFWNTEPDTRLAEELLWSPSPTTFAADEWPELERVVRLP